MHPAEKLATECVRRRTGGSARLSNMNPENPTSANTNSAKTNSAKTNFETLKNQRYISLVTFKRNGDRVATPLWFAPDQGKLLAYTNLDSGKVKRIRNSAKVEIAPCTMKGETTGAYVSATATILDASQGSYVHGLLNHKYTWQKALMEATATIPHVLRIKRRKPDAFLSFEL
jgi:uncharacterized protein